MIPSFYLLAGIAAFMCIHSTGDPFLIEFIDYAIIVAGFLAGLVAKYLWREQIEWRDKLSKVIFYDTALSGDSTKLADYYHSRVNINILATVLSAGVGVYMLFCNVDLILVVICAGFAINSGKEAVKLWPRIDDERELIDALDTQGIMTIAQNEEISTTPADIEPQMARCAAGCREFKIFNIAVSAVCIAVGLYMVVNNYGDFTYEFLQDRSDAAYFTIGMLVTVEGACDLISIIKGVDVITELTPSADEAAEE